MTLALSPSKFQTPKACCPEVKRKISGLLLSSKSEEISGLLKKIREAVGVEQEEVQEQTKISLHFIKKLESFDFEGLPESVYVKGFLRSYLRYLGAGDSEVLVCAYIARYEDWQAKKKL
ncbi:MAG: helix-turn-helix domain-containing protein [Oligoflexales bacterium]|nr:helix-turn-helix domain-containing protein [Oligoflexales bacterium]